MTMGPVYRLGRAEWGMLVFLSLLWGGAFFFARIAVAEVPPLTLVLVRVGGAALALWLLLAVLRPGWPGRGQAGAFLLMGVLNNLIPFGLLFWAQGSVTAGAAAVLNATTPVWSLLLGWLLGGEGLGMRRVGGILLGVAGVAVMVGPGALAGALTDSLPAAAILGAAASYAVAGRYGRRFAGTAPLLVATGQVTGSALILLPVVAYVDQPWQLPLPDAGVLAAMAGLAVLSTALAYVVYFRLLARSGPTNTLLVTLLVPVSAMLLGGVFLDEAISSGQTLGMGLIGLGLLLIDGRILKVFRASTATPAQP